MTGADMTPQMSALDRLRDFDLSFLADGVSDRTPRLKNFVSTADELKKFFTLIILQNGPLAVTNPDVDDLWHDFILHSRRYRDFCGEVFGEFIDHQPHSEMDPVPASAVENTIRSYKSEFGEIPDAWLAGASLSRAAIAAGQFPDEMPGRWSGWPGRRLISTSFRES